ncbi:hypothetical protein [Metabacillus sediminilitoris]|uniref:Uncharacterized protein n=1 Tax=Metabacillus sediminilitoris TaxID=2567941 RepID=A0A4V3WE13_9BACI|nr:hypothetical protein [Metabacillus sediminilitoris]QGQ45914.1 hypothetical protein GMB29_12135 [Metabacillus sediminilitoris]THF74439.1 hypothetical protein E6W99_25300 [Metabacillus sediminilitoris]
MVLVSLNVFAVASLLLIINSENILVVFLSVSLWGLSFGGSATLLQTALAQVLDIAIPMSATFWNLAIAVNGILLDTLGAQSIPWIIIKFLLQTAVYTRISDYLPLVE